ncbi:MAG TPA: GNAT family N-acetyltransferase [Bacteroidia bacterium]|nr:GNAT family N-acetyltransferase [Bacteroidia bacterium]
MQHAIVINVAEKADYKLLADLGRRAFEEAFGRFNDPGDLQTYLDLAFHPETIRSQLQNPLYTFLLATWDEEPVGYAKLFRGECPEPVRVKSCIQLERIYALQSYVGRKVGKSLMEHCVEIAKAEHFERIWLTVWQQNEVAITFYKKWHFEVVGTKKFTIGKEINDDYIMSLDVNKIQ